MPPLRCPRPARRTAPEAWSPRSVVSRGASSVRAGRSHFPRETGEACWHEPPALEDAGEPPPARQVSPSRSPPVRDRGPGLRRRLSREPARVPRMRPATAGTERGDEVEPAGREAPGSEVPTRPAPRAARARPRCGPSAPGPLPRRRQERVGCRGDDRVAAELGRALMTTADTAACTGRCTGRTVDASAPRPATLVPVGAGGRGPVPAAPIRGRHGRPGAVSARDPRRSSRRGAGACLAAGCPARLLGLAHCGRRCENGSGTGIVTPIG
jgi:hypothetical protein